MSVILSLLHTDLKPVDKHELLKMLDGANFFEADQSSHQIHENVGIGHLLLRNATDSFMDEGIVRHPQYPVMITADARIDNRQDLLKKLKIDNTNISDARLILETYVRYGEECVHHLIGAFACIIWDEREQKIFCARDHVGVRPFFYYFKDNVFAACSVVKGLVALPGIDLSIDDKFICDMLVTAGQEKTTTFHKYIKYLLPAHTLTIKDQKIIIRKYWTLDIDKSIFFKDPDDYIEAFREKMFEAVSCRINTNQNIGVELSGGLDSSGITAVASECLKNNGKELYTFSYVMKPENVGKVFPYIDEGCFVDEVCAKAGIRHKTLITSRNFESILESHDLSLWLNEGLYYNCGLGLDTLREHAQLKNVNVLLSGFPGDELVTSFAKTYYLDYLENNEFGKYFKTFIKEKKRRKKLIEMAFWRFISKINNKLASKLHQRFGARLAGIPRKKFEKNYFSKSFLDRHPEFRSDNYLKVKDPEFLSFNFKDAQRRAVLRKFTHERMAGENIAGLYRRMETRYPLADIRLMQYVLSLPVDQKRNSEYERLIFRKGLADMLPESVVWRNIKNGSTVPFWFDDYQRLHPGLIEWLTALKTEKRVEFLDIDKLIDKANLMKIRDQLTPGVSVHGRKQNKVQKLARFIQNNPGFQMDIFNQN